ncbi:MAG: hypothetical protein RR635_00330 [Oscillospiraceae bacterium]
MVTGKVSLFARQRTHAQYEAPPTKAQMHAERMHSSGGERLLPPKAAVRAHAPCHGCASYVTVCLFLPLWALWLICNGFLTVSL